MKISTTLVLMIATMLMIAGCQVTMPEGEETTPTGEYVIEIGDVAPAEEGEQAITAVPEEEEIAMPENGVVIQAVEGELVTLKPEAIDPDKDVVKFSFTPPFNENGKWQTKIGDAGQYLVTITASDGKDTTSQDVLVVIKKANLPPVLECPEEITVKEGETISINCNIYDPEGESIVVEYSGFMKSSTYTTDYEDAGEYSVMIKAGDKEKVSSTTIKVKVTDVNRVPEIKGIQDEITIMEGDVITLSPEASDPDGEKVTITYTEPFDAKGSWKTKVGDAGVIKASVIASDGRSTTKKDFTVIVTQKNTAPVLEKINDITVNEGEKITIPVDATDREGDELDVTVSGWMNSLTYTTTYEDAG
ncbi:immunoglobulin domain-containing protein, partial [Candidatus Woesearchaeota archaeon]|nr:immunoglobulin domain-containing protein [Candidatus Woesearchaeota archaeon]